MTLSRLASAQGGSVTLALRRAIAASERVHRALDEGDKVLLRAPDGSMTRLTRR